MANVLVNEITKFLEIIADPIRLEIIRLMKDKPINAKEIEEELEISQSYTSQQLKALKEAHLIDVRKEGTLKHYSIKNKKIFKVLSGIRDFVVEKEENKFAELKKLDKLNALF
ncbi:MAG: metalloregulator ArsR/SmtB family transcription factor [Promethearchaeia archaeon]